MAPTSSAGPSIQTIFKGHNRAGTSVTGDVPAGDTPAWFAECSFKKGWRDLRIMRGDVLVGAIDELPDTGKRKWWGECA